jgi:hypothetical protein
MRRSTIIVLTLLLLFTSIPTFLGPAHAGTVTWSSPSPLDSALGMDILPSAFQTTGGTMWLVWQSNRANPAVFLSDIYYVTRSDGVWSLVGNLTTPGDNVNKASPAIAQTSDGTLYVFYSANYTGAYKVYYKTFANGAWSQQFNATSTTGTASDCSSTAVLGSNGAALYLFWARGTPCDTGVTNIFYKTRIGGVWSSEKQLTNDNTLVSEPKAFVMNDGRLWLVFSEYVTSGKETQIFDRIYDGTTWSPEAQIVSSSTFDDHPDMIQDRNGTLWLFWTREVPLGSNNFDDQIFSQFSLNNGVTWSAQTQMTFDPSCCQTDSWGPSAVQSIDKTVWLFFSSSQPTGGNFDLFFMQSNPIFPVHDVQVSAITTSPACPFPTIAQSSPTCLYPGGFKTIGESSLITIYVTISDIGDFNESFTLQASAINKTTIPLGSAAGSVLSGHSTVLTIQWNTNSSMKPGRYGIMATMSGLAGESIGNQANNVLLTSNLVHLIPLGDIDQDGSVTFIDASVVAYAFQSTPSSPKWTPYADMDGDGYVSFIDVSIMAVNFGTFT